MSTTAFDPPLHGFHFRNEFVNHILYILGYGNVSTYGLCAGMSFKALDYFHGSAPIPTHNSSDFGPGHACPPQGTLLYQDIYDRQLNLFNPLITPSVIKFVTGVPFDETIGISWSQITAKINSGEPCPIGLKSAEGLQKCHVVVATGYSAKPSKTIEAYDCNHPDMRVSLTLDSAAKMVYESTGETWTGLFLLEYSAMSADYLDVVMSAPVTTNPFPPKLANPAEVGFTVQNTSEFPAHIAALDV